MEQNLDKINWIDLSENPEAIHILEQHQDKIVHNYRLDIQTIDCSDDQDPNIKSKLDQYNVDGFPSIKLLKEGDPPSKAIDFDAKPTPDSLNQFIQEVL